MKKFIITFFILLSFSSLAFDKLKILYIGDSHTVGPFGQRLDTLIRKSGHDIETIGASGSIIRWYRISQPAKIGFYRKTISGKVYNAKGTKVPKFTERLHSIKPNYVIVALGANYVKGYKESFIRKEVLDLAEEIVDANATCIWILPPDTRLYRNEKIKTSEIIRSEISKYCHVIDSIDYTSYPAVGGDGLHYNTKQGTKWANDLYDNELKSLLK